MVMSMENNKKIRGMISIILLGIIGVCLYFIFKPTEPERKYDSLYQLLMSDDIPKSGTMHSTVYKFFKNNGFAEVINQYHDDDIDKEKAIYVFNNAGYHWVIQCDKDESLYNITLQQANELSLHIAKVNTHWTDRTIKEELELHIEDGVTSIRYSNYRQPCFINKTGESIYIQLGATVGHSVDKNKYFKNLKTELLYDDEIINDLLTATSFDEVDSDYFK